MAETSNRQDQLNSAISSHRSGNLKVALAGYNHYLASAPDHLEICSLAAEAAFGLKDFAQAASLLGRIAKAQPNNAQAHFNHGVCCKEAGDQNAAARAFSQAIAIRPDYAAAQFQLGVSLSQLGQQNLAVEAYRRAIELEPGNIEALSNCAVALKDLRRFNDSLALYRRAIALQPNHAGLNYNFGLALEGTERIEQAVAAFRKATDINPNLTLAYSSLARCMSRLGQHEDAVIHYRRALSLKPGSAELESKLGLALQATGAFEEAIEAHRRALERTPESETCLCAFGETLTACGRYDEAISAFDQALELKPDFHEAIAKKGLALEELGRATEIVADLKLALEKQPDATDLAMSLARSLLQSGDAQGAIDVCDRCLTRHPGLTTALAYRALALRETEKLVAARALVDLEGLIQPLSIPKPNNFQSIAAFNEDLSRHILAHPTLLRDPPGHATKAGRHTGELLIEPKGPIADLEKAINAAVESYMRQHPKAPDHPFLARQPERWTLNIWSVVLEAQGHQIPHIHPAAWLSGVYYVQIPEIVARSGNNHAGWIEFGQPSANLNCSATPELRDIQPEEGLMVLFPAYFYHRTLPFDTEGTRISIAFDVLPFGES